MWNPVLPAIALSWWVFRAWTGAVTWTTVAGLVVSVLWLVLAIAIRRAGGDGPEALLNDKPAPANDDAQLRQAVATVREIQRRNAMPPPTVPTQGEIRATARPAIFIKRAAFPVPLDRPGRSYFGGLPRLPPELAWPEKATDERVALTFLAQIDLAELPEIDSSPLPRSGTLYFFSDTNNDGGEPMVCRVLYYAGDASTAAIRDLPDNARPYGIGGEPWPWLADESVWARTNFRFPLEFAKVSSYRDYFIEEGASYPPARNKEALDKLIGDEIEKRFGPSAAPAQTMWDTLRQTREEWPFDWADDETRAAFRHELRGSPDAARDLPSIVVAACYVSASHDALDVIPQTYRNLLAEASAPSLRSPRHQMLGHALPVQWAPIQHAADVLLLQLMGDDGLGWHSNIGCTLQFWISADSLERLDFDAVELTLECD
jgi:hypothetical protein